MAFRTFKMGVDRFGKNSSLQNLIIDDEIIQNFLNNEYISENTNLLTKFFSDLYYLQIVIPDSFKIWNAEKLKENNGADAKFKYNEGRGYEATEVAKNLNHLVYYNSKSIKTPSIDVDYYSKKLFNRHIRTMMSANSSTNLSINMIETSNLVVKKIFWEFLRNLHPDITVYQYYPDEIAIDIYLIPLKYVMEADGRPVINIAGNDGTGAKNSLYYNKNTGKDNDLLNNFMRPHCLYFNGCQVTKISNSNYDVYESQKNFEQTTVDFNYSYLDFIECEEQ